MLSPPLATERYWLPVRGGSSSRVAALGSAALAHLAVLAVLLRVAAPALPPAPASTAVTMLFTAPAAAPAPAPVAVAVPMRPPVAPVVPVVRTEAPTPHAARLARPPHALAPAVPRPPRTPVGIAASGPPAAASHVAPAAASDSGFMLARFTSDIQAVVRAAAVMPAAARRQHREGRAEIRFDYLDGAVRGVALAQSSASRVLDDAALAAVQTARYPAAPAPLRGRTLPMVVWVDFRIGGGAPG